MSIHEDTPADIEIKRCINANLNFAVVAGAGSGKTGSLVKALSYVRSQYGKSLRVANQHVACITYTNAAVEVIKRRTDLDELFVVSTIHGFLWSLVENYQADIRTTLRDGLIPERIEKKKNDDNGGKSKTAQKAREQVAKLTFELDTIHLVQKFSYVNSINSNYSLGSLGHIDIIDLVAMMIKRLPNLRKIIGQKYPYIFIDEAQDTFSNVMEALNLVATGNGLPLIGYFGDPIQQIYENRAGEFEGPDNYRLIKKVENYRCSRKVIKLLNVIRPDLQQTPGEKNAIGSVEIRLIQAEDGEGERNTYTDVQLLKALSQFDAALEHFQWSQSDEVKRLFLTRQMIAYRLGFSKLNQLFTGKYASQTADNEFKEGNYFALKPFGEILIPLFEAHEKNDYAAKIQILRQFSPLLDPQGNSKTLTIKEVTEKAQTAINTLIAKWSVDSIKDILNWAGECGLINLSDRLKGHLIRNPRSENYDETVHELEKGDWLIDELLSYKTEELATYRRFILDLTPYSTQHGVKGDEFKKVLVVFDDTEANWNLYSFSKLLTPGTAGKEPTDGQKQKSRNLAYVCFSRAEVDLRIILFTKNPSMAKQELINKGMFSEEQISTQVT